MRAATTLGTTEGHFVRLRADPCRRGGVLPEDDAETVGRQYCEAVRGTNRLDLLVALCFVLAALGETLLRQPSSPGLLAVNGVGSLGLAVLAVRRRHPVLVLGVLAALGVIGTLVSAALWPAATDTGGVWLLALMFAAYSLGAHGSRRSLWLGAALPLLVVVAADLQARTGWQRINGIVFVSVFVGLLPTLVGWLVHLRHEALSMLDRQRAEIESRGRLQQGATILAKRLRTAERLEPELLDGLRGLAAQAESSADPASIEDAARSLLARTREEVVALTSPVSTTAPPAPRADHLPALRSSAQRWVVLGAGAVTVGLVLETSLTLAPDTSPWVIVPAAIVVGTALSLLWWRPVLAATVAFVATTAYARLIAPLDGSLSGTALAMGTTFTVSVLTRGRGAVLALCVCLLGQLVGVGTDDRLGDGLVLTICWLGGCAVNQVSLLVEETRANNLVLSRKESFAAEQALVAERLRLARDIHDIVGHSLTVITLQAGAARHLATTDPQRADEVIATVAELARDGLDALTRGSQLGDVSTLVARVCAAGLDVDADLSGEVRLEPDGRLVAMRVVQEALTNILRHAPGARATVSLREVGGRIEVRVANTAPATEPGEAGTGRGLPGIRQHVAAARGEVRWGALPEGGFEICATWPVTDLAELGQ